MQKLNLQQHAAVTHLNSPLLVIAGAGSGKTGVITQKIAHLINGANYEPKNIFAVTFTNKAAREMQERCKKLLGNQANELNISTFHRLGLNFIRAEHELLGMRANFCILDAQDCLNIIKELMQSSEDARANEFQMLISSYKNENITPERALAENLQGAALYFKYEERLRAYNVLDFDDLLLRPLRLLQENPEVYQRWRSKVKYLLIDEYQDTNGVQYQLMKLLAGESFTAVGDDDQSIYAWRGARPENIAQLQMEFPHLTTIKLEQNYRCHQKILAAANQLISNNPHLVEKRLWSELTKGNGVSVRVFTDDAMEARTVASDISLKIKVKGYKASEFAILYRSNFQARVFEEYLRDLQIPYEISGGISLFDYAEIRDMTAYLRLINNSSDDSAFLRICNTPKREIGATTIQKLSNYAARRKMSLFNAAQEFAFAAEITPKAYEYLQLFIQWIVELQKLSYQEPAAVIFMQVLQQSDYESHLYSLYGEPKKVEKRMKRLHGFKNWLVSLGERDEALQELELLMNHLNLRDVLNRQDNKQEAVQMMTLHSAKGLEFREVFIVGCEEGLLPHANSKETIEEERRLLYVGMTRAKENLILSYCKNRGSSNFAAVPLDDDEEEYEKTPRKKTGKHGKTVEASRFFEELPQEGIIWEDGKYQMSAEEEANFRAGVFDDILDSLR